MASHSRTNLRLYLKSSDVNATVVGPRSGKQLTLSFADTSPQDHRHCRTSLQLTPSFTRLRNLLVKYCIVCIRLHLVLRILRILAPTNIKDTVEVSVTALVNAEPCNPLQQKASVERRRVPIVKPAKGASHKKNAA